MVMVSPLLRRASRAGMQSTSQTPQVYATTAFNVLIQLHGTQFSTTASTGSGERTDLTLNWTHLGLAAP